MRTERGHRLAASYAALRTTAPASVRSRFPLRDRTLKGAAASPPDRARATAPAPESPSRGQESNRSTASTGSAACPAPRPLAALAGHSLGLGASEGLSACSAGLLGSAASGSPSPRPPKRALRCSATALPTSPHALKSSTSSRLSEKTAGGTCVNCVGVKRSRPRAHKDISLAQPRATAALAVLEESNINRNGSPRREHCYPHDKLGLTLLAPAQRSSRSSGDARTMESNAGASMASPCPGKRSRKDMVGMWVVSQKTSLARRVSIETARLAAEDNTPPRLKRVSESSRPQSEAKRVSFPVRGTAGTTWRALRVSARRYAGSCRAESVPRSGAHDARHHKR